MPLGGDWDLLSVPVSSVPASAQHMWFGVVVVVVVVVGVP